MNQFFYPCHKKDFDFYRCLYSGQVFRWSSEDKKGGILINGDSWYDVKSEEEGYHISTNTTQEEFEKLFSLQINLNEIYQDLQQDYPELSHLIVQSEGMRLMRPNCTVEVLFGFLCTPNNHMERILKMVCALGEYGNKNLYKNWKRFPSLEQLSQIDPLELRSKGFGYRAENIPFVANQILDKGGNQWIESLKKVSWENLLKELVSLKGIGHKLANCVALFGFHHPQAAPIDVHTWKQSIKLYFPEWEGKALTENKYLILHQFLNDRFGERLCYAQQMLFYSSFRERRKNH